MNLPVCLDYLNILGVCQQPVYGRVSVIPYIDAEVVFGLICISEGIVALIPNYLVSLAETKAV